MDHSLPTPQIDSNKDSSKATNPPFFQSKLFIGVLYGIAVVVILLLTFEAGVYTGYQRAVFSAHWTQNYQSNFFPHPEIRGLPFPGEHGMMNSHGAFGDIIKIDSGSIVVKGRDEAEKNILVQAGVSIVRGFDTLQISDLAVGQHVIIFGDPNEAGQIQAKLIRVLPQVVSFLH